MAQSPITISSNALVLLGEQSISSFNDDTTSSQVASQLYNTTVEAMLTETQWHFATRSALLAKHAVKPDNGWENRFQLPVDCIYVVQASVSNYEIYERDLFANAESVRIMYVYHPDEVNMPAHFVKALEYNLASLFAIPVTGSSSRAEYYRQLYEAELKRARFADASQRPNNQIQDSPYLEVRG